MRVLFSTLSPRAYMAPPIFGDEQINCGPDWKDEKDENARYLSLATPVGSYDLALVASRLPPEQAPDLVVCLIDASRRSMPRNLAAFKCPRVVLVGDTGHMQSPLMGMLQYLSSEPYHRIVLPYDRHHASIFRTAVFKRIHWFPGITFPHSDAAVRNARKKRREQILAFTGQVGKYHPRRCRLVEALKESGLPLVIRQIQQSQALQFYGESLVGFNASLNGGVNLRVFEILSTGGALLTDRITPAAGLDQILREGTDRISYTGTEDLLEKAEYLLTHPTRTSEIGLAGASWFDRTMNESRRRTAFHQLAFDGKDLPEFEFSEGEKSSLLFGGSLPRLVQSVAVYEGIQELHRVKETVRVAIDPSVPEDFSTLCQTLPRAEIRNAAASERTDYLATCSDRVAEQSRTMYADRIWCWDAEPARFEALLPKVVSAGYVCRSQVPALFEKMPSLASGGDRSEAQRSTGSSLEILSPSPALQPKESAALT